MNSYCTEAHTSVGDGVGTSVGDGVGSSVGDGVGSVVGEGVGSSVGDGVGFCSNKQTNSNFANLEISGNFWKYQVTYIGRSR